MSFRFGRDLPTKSHQQIKPHSLLESCEVLHSSLVDIATSLVRLDLDTAFSDWNKKKISSLLLCLTLTINWSTVNANSVLSPFTPNLVLQIGDTGRIVSRCTQPILHFHDPYFHNDCMTIGFMAANQLGVR